MTLPELIMGLAISTMVFLGAASLMFSTAMSWKQSESGQSMALASSQAVARVAAKLSAAKYLGVVRKGSVDGSAAQAGGVLYWKDDNGDGMVQQSEMAWLEHNTAQQVIYLYELKPRTALTIAEKTWADAYLTASGITASAYPDNFKSASAVQKNVLARYVSGAMFEASLPSDPMTMPSVQMVLTLSRNYTAGQTALGAEENSAERRYATVTMRGATTQPN